LQLSGEDYNATICRLSGRHGACYVPSMKPYLGFMWSHLGRTVVNNQWLFMAGGQETRQWSEGLRTNYMDYQNETILVNGDGVLVRGPDLSSGKLNPCVAVVEDQGDIKVIAVIGGQRRTPSPDPRIWRTEKTKNMERFRCDFGQSKPSCEKISDGPDMMYPKGPTAGGCVVIKTADDKRVLMALRDQYKHKQFEMLDLSQANYQWQILSFPDPEPVQSGDRDNYNIVTGADEKTAYWTKWQGVRGKDFIYKVTCQTPSECNFEKVWYTQQGFETKSNTPDHGHMAVSVPAEGSFVCP